MSASTTDRKLDNASLCVGSGEHEHLWTESWVATLVHISRATLRRWRKQGRGPPFVKLGNRRGSAVRYLPADVLGWLATRRSGGERAA
jgi:predicted DNA-binding transcriptional regulator AlpA